MGLSKPKVHIGATLCACAAILAYQIFVPPVVGLADQGDFARVLHYFQLGPAAKTAEERYYAYLNRTYVHDPEFRTPGCEFFTSELLFVGASVELNRWISADGRFDVSVVGFVHALAFLSGAYLLLGTVLPMLNRTARVVVCAGLLFVFCDGGYIAYFNSFYSEPAVFAFFLLLLGFWLRVVMSPTSAGIFAFACGRLLDIRETAGLHFGAPARGVCASIPLDRVRPKISGSRSGREHRVVHRVFCGVLRHATADEKSGGL